MQNNKSITKVIATIVLSLLMIGSAFLVSSNTKTTTVSAQTSTIPSNLLQYEWPTPRASPSASCFSAGPAPNSPSIKWRTAIPGAGGYLVAFDGMVFIQKALSITTFGSVYALDGGTGKIVWSYFQPASVAVSNIAKIDDAYMLIGSTCVKIADGTVAWVGPPGFAYGQSVINGAGYLPELKMFVDPVYGWNLPDPSKPPTLAWNLTSQQNVNNGFCVYGDGKVFIGSQDGFLRAVDAKTGNLTWETPLTSSFLYGASYYNGMVIQGGLDNNMRAWDANTGKLLWTYNPGTWYGQWASSTGVAYGMVYEHNQDNYVYAINATNGKLVWRQHGPGIGYSNILSIADGKVYVQMGDKEYRDFATGVYAYSEYDCYDAYTGKLVWTLPMENGAPFNAQCIAYGNLYICPTVSPAVPGVWTYTSGGRGSIGEVWCISSTVKDWPMFMSDPAHTAEGAGPTNLQLKWKFHTGAQVVSSPTAANGVVYFGSLDSNIYAVDADTGSQKWAFKTGFPAVSSPAVVNGKVYTGADNGNIYCIDAVTGSQLWKTFAGGISKSLLGNSFSSVPVRSSPIVLNGKVYAGALDGNLYVLDANSGTVLWKYQTGGPIMATPAADDSGVYIASSTGGYPIGSGPAVLNGDLYKLDANTGSIIWHLAIPYVLNRTLGLGNFLFAAPTVANGMVFVRNGFLYNYAINATTGAIIWTYTAMYNPGTPTQSGGVIQFGAPLYAYNAVYLNDFYSISAVNATDGTRVWSTYMSREDISQAITYAYGRIYVVTEAGVLYVLDASTGAKLSYYEFGNLQLHSAPTPYNGSVYVGANDWNVYCFGEARLMSAAKAAPVQASASVVLPQANLPTPAALMPAAQTPVTTTSSAASPTTLYVAAAAAAIIIIAAAALALRRRK